MSMVDVLVLAPTIPAIAVFATWWLSWERWIPWIKLSHILGPYLIYAAFAAWYFGLPEVVVLIASCGGGVLTVIAVASAVYQPPAQRDALAERGRERNET